MSQDFFLSRLKNVLPFNFKVNIVHTKSSIITVKKNLFITTVNIHHSMITTDLQLIQDIAHFITQKNSLLKKQSKKRIIHYYKSQLPVTSPSIKLEFQYHNLKLLFQKALLNASNKIKDLPFQLLKITWGKKSYHRRTSIRFGSFHEENNLIRIHPALDNPAIPEYFIMSVLYHEIAHFIYKKKYPDSHRHHDQLYYNLLKQLDPDYSASELWEKDNKHLFFY